MTAKELREKYEADLKEMQAKCAHTEQSDWIPSGHFTIMGRVCLICDKVLEDTAFETRFIGRESKLKRYDGG